MVNEKYLKFLVYITIFFVFVLAVLVGVWGLYPYKPVTTSPAPFKIVYPLTKVVEQGGYVTYEFKYNKTMNITPTVQRQFVDGIVFNVASQQPSSLLGVVGKGTARSQIHIPETLPPGRYHIRIVSTYQVNPIRQIIYDNVTETFEVITGNHLDKSLDREEGL